MSIRPPSKTLTHRFHRRLSIPSVDLPPIVVKVPEAYKIVQPFVYSDLIRLGNLADGGYVLPKALSLEAQALVSLGLSLEWSFEHDFAAFHPSAQIYGYDHTTRASLREELQQIYIYLKKKFLHSRLMWPLRLLKRKLTRQPPISFPAASSFDQAPEKYFARHINIKSLIEVNIHRLLDYYFFWQRAHKHISKKVTKETAKGNISLAEIFAGLTLSPIVVKIDIEGSEYQTIDAIWQNAGRIAALVIEFHEIDQDKDRFLSAIRKLNEKFAIVHAHGNNFSPLTQDGFPDVIELTFIQKDKLTTTEKRTAFPVAGLDYPNLWAHADYALQF